MNRTVPVTCCKRAVRTWSHVTRARQPVLQIHPSNGAKQVLESSCARSCSLLACWAHCRPRSVRLEQVRLSFWPSPVTAYIRNQKGVGPMRLEPKWRTEKVWLVCWCGFGCVFACVCFLCVCLCVGVFLCLFVWAPLGPSCSPLVSAFPPLYCVNFEPPVCVSKP